MHSCELYSESSAVTKRDAADYLKKYGHLLSWKEYKENVLEIGCADGSITRKILYPYIEDYVAKVTATDISETMIELAKAGNDEDGIEFKAMDMSNDNVIEDMECKFDHIFSFYCIHWILDQRALMDRLYKILTPGGQIFITTATRCPMHDTFHKHCKEETWSKYLPNTDPFVNYSDDPEQYMQCLLEQAGFEVQICKHEKKNNIIDDLKSFARGLIGMHPFSKYIPTELREKYIQEHVRSFCEASTQLDNPNQYDVPYGSMIFVATKKL